MADNRFTFETDMGKIAGTELPWNSPHWHPPHGGIYRNVYLHVTDPLHISLPLYSNLKTVGPYIYSTDISEKSAAVHAEIPVQNERTLAEPIEAKFELLDRNGKSVLVLKESRTLAAGAREAFNLTGTLRDPQLWEPSYPYLYRAVCILSAKGGVMDRVEFHVGIRSVRWDVKTGFSINGHYTKLHGWGQKPTSEWPGWARRTPTGCITSR